MTRRLLAALLSGLLLNGAFGQTNGYPNRPIHIIYPYPAGQTSDLALRAVGEFLGTDLKQAVVIENRSGASGLIGTRYVADSAPNGYTLTNTSSGPIAAVSLMFKNPGYDGLKSFSHIGLYMTLPWMLVVRSEFPARNIAELVAYARANPGQLNMSEYSAAPKLMMMLLAQAGKFQVQDVPYPGPTQILPDLYDGQIQAAFFPMDLALAQAKAGKVRILGTASAKPLHAAPNFPVISEQLPGVVWSSWQGLAAPAGTAPEIVAKLAAALTAITEKPAFQERMQALSLDVTSASPEQTEQLIRSEMLIWAKFVKETGIQPQ